MESSSQIRDEQTMLAGMVQLVLSWKTVILNQYRSDICTRLACFSDTPTLVPEHFFTPLPRLLGSLHTTSVQFSQSRMDPTYQHNSNYPSQIHPWMNVYQLPTVYPGPSTSQFFGQLPYQPAHKPAPSPPPMPETQPQASTKSKRERWTETEELCWPTR